MKKLLVNAINAWPLPVPGLTKLLPKSTFTGKLSIFMYHGVVRQPLPISDWCFISEKNFKRQMQYLSQHFDVLKASEAIAKVQADAIDRPTAVITFDDGYQNVHEIAFPILRQYGLPATIFLNTGFVDTDRSVWFCSLIKMLELTKEPALDWQGTRYPLKSTRDKVASSQALQAALKQRSHQQLLEQLSSIARSLNVHEDQRFDAQSAFRILSSDSINDLASSGLIEFGAHTATHTILTQVPQETARREIAESIEQVRTLSGQSCEIFAYPNGDYDHETLLLMKEAGITLAMTTKENPMSKETARLELNRYGISNSLGMLLFQLKAHHLMY